MAKPVEVYRIKASFKKIGTAVETVGLLKDKGYKGWVEGNDGHYQVHVALFKTKKAAVDFYEEVIVKFPKIKFTLEKGI